MRPESSVHDDSGLGRTYDDTDVPVQQHNAAAATPRLGCRKILAINRQARPVGHLSSPFQVPMVPVRSSQVSSLSCQRRKTRRAGGPRRAVAVQTPPPPPPAPRPFSAGGMRQTRLSTRVTTLPRRVDLYFAGNLMRQLVWSIIAFATGFYTANTITLSFGALAVNDVVAAAVSVAFCEVCSRLYYSAPRVTLKLVFLNAFKMGVTAALIADAFKLAG